MEELRTPPVPLVALVGCPEYHGAISLYLHREQPPLNTLALPDFAKLPIIGGKERKPVDARMPPPLGILKADWLTKHRTRMPAVLAVLLDRDQVYGDPTQWLEVCTNLDNIKAVIRGRNIKLVVAIVQPTSQGEVNEERLSALRKRAEVDAKCCILFITHEPSELRRSLARLGSIMGELATTFYREEGRRVKLRVEKKSYSSLELSVRYNFKIAVYAEFRRDWVAALKFYETAYSLLQEVITSTSMELQPVQRVVEMKAVAEQLHFKISNLLLHGGKETEAVRWFREHASWYKQMVGPFEGYFLHWAWISKQFQVFGELLQNRLATVAPPAQNTAMRGQPVVSERELQPAYYYHVSAIYMVKRRRAFQAALVAFEAFEESNAPDVLVGPPEEVGPPVYVGQAPRLLKRGNDNHAQSPTETEYMRHLILLEKNFQHPLIAIALLKKAHELYQLVEATRTAYRLLNDMGCEYFAAKDYVNAMRILNSVIGIYRQEEWVVLLGSTLTYLRECARCLGLAKEFAEYSFELLSLPLSATVSHGYVSGSEVEPFGELEKTQLCQELVEFLRGVRYITSQEGKPGMKLSSAQPINLEINVQSPLRMVLSVCVAFHNQSVRVGKVTRLTLSILTHLPLPVVFDEVEILFDQSSCNFSTQKNNFVEVDQEDLGPCSMLGLELEPLKWKRISIDVAPEETGKLECLELVARWGPHTTIRCQVESMGTREEIPFWKSEPGIDVPPSGDPALASLGQKLIQVEEPEALVDISVEASSPGLVGEAFPVCFTISSAGHSIQSGDLEVYFAPSVNSEATLASMSPPRGPDLAPAELLVRKTGENAESIGDNYEIFAGLVEVPEISIGDSWSTIIYVRWFEPKAVTLMTTFVYRASEAGMPKYQYRLHKSKELDCVEALAIEHHYVAPFRRDSLLLGNLDANTIGGQVPAATLALKESSILVVTLKNQSSISLRLLKIEATEEDRSRCLLQKSGSGPLANDPDGEAGGIIVAPQEIFTQLLWVHPLVLSKSLLVGTISVLWQRTMSSDVMPNISEVPIQHHKDAVDFVSNRVPLAKIMVESPPLVITLDCPPHAVLGKPFTMTTKVQNLTSTLLEVAFSVVDTASFIFSGAHSDTVSILPRGTHFLSYKLVPLFSGIQQLPRVKINSAWYNAAFQPSPVSTQIFVFPSTRFEPNTHSSVDEAFGSLVIS